MTSSIRSLSSRTPKVDAGSRRDEGGRRPTWELTVYEQSVRHMSRTASPFSRTKLDSVLYSSTGSVLLDLNVSYVMVFIMDSRGEVKRPIPYLKAPGSPWVRPSSMHALLLCCVNRWSNQVKWIVDGPASGTQILQLLIYGENLPQYSLTIEASSLSNLALTHKSSLWFKVLF